MKRRLFTFLAVLLALPLGSTYLHAQKYFRSDKPMSFGYSLKIYHNVQRNNLFALANHIPEDKYFVKPPTTLKEIPGEQQSIAHLFAEAANTAWRMCTIITTGAPTRPPATVQPGNIVMASASPTKAAMIDALKKAFDVCDPIVENFDDSKITTLVMSQYALQPLGTTIMNVVSHNREIIGRIESYMVVFGIPSAPGTIGAVDPTNRDILFYCGGQALKTPNLCKQLN
jgi:hypothetical protein